MSKKEIISLKTQNKINVCIIGLGKMGLPLACVFADKGFKVIGVDKDKNKVKKINMSQCPIVGEPGLKELLKKNIKNGFLRATTNLKKAIEKSQIIIILIPLLINKYKRVEYFKFESLIKKIGEFIKKGSFLIIETTLPPGYTTERLVPLLEKGGKVPGRDIGLAVCPERTSSGRAIQDITSSWPKVVGGVNEKSTRIAALIYSFITSNKIIKTDSSSAEMAKVMQGVYRDLNIALANELSLFCDKKGIDFWEARKVGNTDPNCNIHKAGLGVGGHCIPVYPWFVINEEKCKTSLLRLGRKINDNMPYKVKKFILKKIKRPNIFILGISYRGGVKEIINSPALILEKILRKAATTFVFDPLFSESEIKSLGLKYRSLDDISKIDVIVIGSSFKEFKNYDWKKIKEKMKGNIVVDPMAILDKEKMERLGFSYYRQFSS